MRARVIGMGASGCSAARFLRGRVDTLELVDDRDSPEVPEGIVDLPGCFGSGCVLRALDESDWDLRVVSPGIDVRGARGALTNDVALFGDFFSGSILGVTGTNGKSTVTRLLEWILLALGREAAAGGNIGVPALDLLATSVHWAVLELSSFQLELARSLPLRAAVVLNISPDHLDRYAGQREYAQAKAGIWAGQSAEDLLVVNAEDALTRAMLADCPPSARVRRFGAASDVDAHLIDGAVHLDGQCWSLEGTALRGQHNLENLAAVLLVLQDLGMLDDPDRVRAALRDFRPLAHRMELVCERAGVRWVDDSKATNPAAVLKALEGQPGNQILILGGDFKGADPGVLRVAIEASCKLVLVMGPRGAHIIDGLGEISVPTLVVEHMDEAVEQAGRWAVWGDQVLLSPGGASFDLFRSYAHRGECFRQAVEALDERSGRLVR